jgi:uncharacterized membrane protein
MNTAPSDVPAISAGEDKTIAILSYLTLIGFIVAIVMHGTKKTRLGSFHLRQSLGLMLMAIAIMIVAMILMIIPILGWLMAMCLWLGLLVLWVMGFIAAINGEQKPIPVVGPLFQKWFGTAFD